VTTDALTAIALLAVGGLLIVLTRRGRPRLTRQVRAGVRATLAAYPALDRRRAYTALTRSRDGLAIALLLLNTAAKHNSKLYEHKAALLRAVVDASRRSDWWMEKHTHPQATTLVDSYVVYVETTVAPILDLARIQISVHISEEEARKRFADAPAADGRSWAGVALQARAEEIAAAFIKKSVTQP
jgi:hypothetical protein